MTTKTTKTGTKIQFRITKSIEVGKSFIKVTKSPITVYVSKSIKEVVSIGKGTQLTITKLQDKKGKSHIYRVKRYGSRRTYYLTDKELFQ